MSIGEMNKNNAIRDRKEELTIIYYKILAVPIKRYNVIWSRLSYKFILQILGDKKNNFKKFVLYAKRGEKMVLYKMLYQKQKCIKWEDKNQEQQTESSYMEDINQLFQ